MLIKFKIQLTHSNNTEELPEDDFLRKVELKKRDDNKLSKDADCYLRINSMDDINCINPSIDKRGNFTEYTELELILCKQPFDMTMYRVKQSPEELMTYIEEELKNDLDKRWEKAKALRTRLYNETFFNQLIKEEENG